MSANVDYGSFKSNVIRFLINYFVRFTLSGVVIYSCWIAIENYSWFSWHVILCTFGYLPLMAEALMLFTGDEIWSRQVSRKTKHFIHGVLITFGTVISICGNAVCFHYISPGYHLYTAHGITGLISMILCIISVALGYGANYAHELRNYARPVWWKLNHNIIGLLGYLIGIMSLCFGYYTHWFVYYTTEESRILALIVTIIGCLWSINNAVKSGCDQIKNVLN